jgi:hypothetical protein
MAEESTPRPTLQTQVLLQALRQPGTAGGNTRQARVRLAQAAHAAQQFAVQGLGVEHQATLRTPKKLWS